MKYFFLLAGFLLITNFAMAKSEPSLPESTMKEIDAFSQKKKLDPKKDYAELKKVLQNVLILDDEDPSRTAVLVLSESYEHNKALYEKALKELETKKNKTQLKEIKYILKTHYIHGNG